MDGRIRSKSRSRPLYCVPLALLLSLLASQVDGSGVTKVGFHGWTPVSEKWPTDQEGYFIAVEERHHFIDVKLPPKLVGELKVQLDFYYKFKTVRPIVKAILCNMREEILQDFVVHPPAGVWNNHEVVIKGKDCEKRNKITYNVILHDDGDVFAWRKMKIESIPPVFTTIAPPTTTEAAELTIPTTTFSIVTTPDSTPTTTEAAELTIPTTTFSIVTTPDSTTTSPATATEGPLPENTSKIDLDIFDTVSTRTLAPEDFDIDSADKSSKKDDDKNSHREREDPESSTESKPEVEPRGKDKAKSSNADTSDKSLEEDDLIVRRGTSRLRFKRALAAHEAGASTSGTRGDSEDFIESGPNGNRIHISCTPAACDRDQFEFKRFTSLSKGLPAKPRLGRKTTMLLNTKDKPLRIQVDSAHEPFNDLDTCLDVNLFLDPGKEVRFTAKGSTALTRTLETISRSSTDSSASKWEQFSRCISDYMPALQALDHEELRQIEFGFVPLVGPRGQRVAIAYDPERAIRTQQPYELIKFIPNAISFSDAAEVNNFWILDRDGIKKPKVTLVNAPTTEGQVAHKVLAVTDIDPTQQSFDILSRWIKLEDAEIAEFPIILNYKAKRPDWIDKIVIGFQRDGWGLDNWRDQIVYEQKNGDQAPTDQSAGASVVDKNNIDIPVNLKGLNSETFRLRIKHVLKSPIEAERATSRSLEISTLAFADVCAMGTFCMNDGTCKPTGTAVAKCECPQGFTGDRCENKNVCDLVVQNSNGLTGGQLCQLAGARCMNSLPVLRCIWPNDEYLQCQSPYQGITEGNTTSQPNDQQTSRPITSQLEELTRTQAKSIIILGVFMISLLIFAVVLIINMVLRLQKSKKRLSRSQNELQELSRRSLPTSSAAFRPGTGRGKPAATLSYNNSAFDVE